MGHDRRQRAPLNGLSSASYSSHGLHSRVGCLDSSCSSLSTDRVLTTALEPPDHALPSALAEAAHTACRGTDRGAHGPAQAHVQERDRTTSNVPREERESGVSGSGLWNANVNKRSPRVAFPNKVGRETQAKHLRSLGRVAWIEMGQ
jgi:hypothetical protein